MLRLYGELERGNCALSWAQYHFVVRIRFFSAFLLAIFLGGGGVDVQPLRAQAQVAPPVSQWAVEARTGYAAVLRYRSQTPLVQFPHAYGLRLGAVKATRGRHAWERLYNYPHVGLDASFYDFNIPELGQALTATARLELILRRVRRFRLGLAPTTGLVYSTKIYDRERNPLNLAVSNRLSFVLQGELSAYWTVTPHWEGLLSLSLVHFSNGALRLPNNGMNFPLLSAGLRHVPRPQPLVRQTADAFAPFVPSWHLDMMLLRGTKEIHQSEARRWPAYVVSGYVSYRPLRHFSLNAGGDVCYDTSLDSEFYWRQLALPPGGIVPWQIGTMAGAEFYFGQLSVLAQGGYYLYLPYQFYRRGYQRYGLKYYFGEHFYANLNLKAYFRKADYIEMGIGLRR